MAGTGDSLSGYRPSCRQPASPMRIAPAPSSLEIFPPGPARGRPRQKQAVREVSTRARRSSVTSLSIRSDCPSSARSRRRRSLGCSWRSPSSSCEHWRGPKPPTPNFESGSKPSLVLSRVRHARVNEPQGRLLGQRGRREPVRFAEERVRLPLQPYPPVLDPGLSQPHDLRKEMACPTACRRRIVYRLGDTFREASSNESPKLR